MKRFRNFCLQDDEGGDIDEGEEGTKEKPSTTGSLGKTRAQNLSRVKIILSCDLSGVRKLSIPKNFR